MPSRHRAREQALQMIFQWDFTHAPIEDVRRSYWKNLSGGTAPAAQPNDFADSLLQGVTSRITEIDNLLRQHAENWRLERMSSVDRNILRLAVFEMLRREAAPAVVINEAIEMGRRYSGDDSIAFLNGVLDAVRKALDEEAVPAAE